MSFRKPVILIADDNDGWLNRMENFFLKKGHKTQRTRFSEEALKMIKDDEDHQIKGIVLDWEFKNIGDTGHQSTLPETVINHIVLNRPDVAIIVVTEAPLSESWNPDGKPKIAITIYNRILKKLKKVRNHSKSIDIEAFLKHELGDDPSEWQKMYTYLQKEMKNKKDVETKQPEYKLLFKLGFLKKELKDYWGRFKPHLKQEKSLAEIVKNIFKDKLITGQGSYEHEEAEQYRKDIVSNLFDQAREKEMRVKSTGGITSKVDLKDTSFAIIEFFAKKDAKNEQVYITVEEFQKLEEKIESKKSTRSHDSQKLLKLRFRRDISKLRTEIGAYMNGVTIPRIKQYRAIPVFPIEIMVYLIKE